MREHDLQVQIITWCRYNQGKYPQLKLIYAIPNQAKRSFALANYLKAEGMATGVPDLAIPAPNKTFSALYIELKIGKNKPTPKQLEWHKMLREYGNCVFVSYNFDDTIDIIKNYLNNNIKKSYV